MASSNPSASNSDTSPSLAPSQQVAGTSNAVPDPEVFDKKPDLIGPLEDIDSEEYIQKFRKYEADYTRRLKAKYFSDKTIFGGNIFDVKMTVDGEIIKASRWPCYKSYADPVSFDDLSRSSSTSATDTLSNASNGKPSEKENN